MLTLDSSNSEWSDKGDEEEEEPLYMSNTALRPTLTFVYVVQDKVGSYLSFVGRLYFDKDYTSPLRWPSHEGHFGGYNI